MSVWIILSWIFVAILTTINVVIFLKLKGASEQMLKMAFPGAKDMNEALSQMQGMMSSMQGAGGRGGNPMAALSAMGMGRQGGPARGGGDAQLKAAMDMLQKMQQKGGRR